MATIVLDPHETFRHRQDDETVTELLRGEVELEILGETRIQLTPGEAVRIPAGSEHSMTNIGPGHAEIICRC